MSRQKRREVSGNTWQKWRRRNRQHPTESSYTTGTTTSIHLDRINENESSTNLQGNQTTSKPQSTTSNASPDKFPTEKSLYMRIIEPGTIIMMNAEYLKQKYLKTGLTTTFHRALLADYFDLSETEMKQMGMTVVAWGFSYQVLDKIASSRSKNRASKFFCDFKFRSATFNAGYVGADIKMDITDIDGSVEYNKIILLKRNIRTYLRVLFYLL